VSRHARAWSPERGSTWVIAHYRCKRGHVWSCGWDSDMRPYWDCCARCMSHHDMTMHRPTEVGTDLPMLPTREARS
jgi:hypothetical protein